MYVCVVRAWPIYAHAYWLSYAKCTSLINTVSVSSVTVMESLVQVTVVAGPPVEIQVNHYDSFSLSVLQVLYIATISRCSNYIAYLETGAIRKYCTTTTGIVLHTDYVSH